MRIEGKTALITGGSSGLGAAAAQMILECGGRVVIADLKAGADLGANAVFAATDVTSAEKLTEKVGAEFDELRQYVEQLKAAGIGDEDFRLKRARVRLTEAKRRTYATTTRMNDLGLKAEFGQDRPIFDTVAEYVGKAEETDERIGKEAAQHASAKRVEQSGQAG